MSAEPSCQEIYYDGSCPLCRREIGFYRRQQGASAITFIDLSQSSQDPAGDLSHQQAMARFHVRSSDGTLRSGAAGFALLWRSLPGFRWIGVVAGWRPVTAMLELGYRGFLPLRPVLARLLGNH
jgi:predicted DCC family thiol-disulfide oxidoreductase YuxK